MSVGAFCLPEEEAPLFSIDDPCFWFEVRKDEIVGQIFFENRLAHYPGPSSRDLSSWHGHLGDL